MLDGIVVSSFDVRVITITDVSLSLHFAFFINVCAHQCCQCSSVNIREGVIIDQQEGILESSISE